jgi:hypothetical protein
VSDDEIIHFPGPVVSFQSIYRQRCSWCGALIQEYDLQRISIQEDGRPEDLRGKPLDPDRELSWWSELVAISGTNPVSKWTVPIPTDGKAPDRSCMVLMPTEP